MIYISERYNSYMKATSKLSASRPTVGKVPTATINGK